MSMKGAGHSHGRRKAGARDSEAVLLGNCWASLGTFEEQEISTVGAFRLPYVRETKSESTVMYLRPDSMMDDVHVPTVTGSESKVTRQAGTGCNGSLRSLMARCGIRG